MTIRKLLVLSLLALAAACGGAGAEEKGKARPAPVVKVEPATTIRFVETIEAVGTARANEQVTLSAPVTERLVRLGFDDGAFVRRGQVVAVLAQGQESAQLAEAQARAARGPAAARPDRGAASKRGFATQSAARRPGRGRRRRAAPRRPRRAPRSASG